MARRKQTTKRRTRRKQRFNVLNAAQTLTLASIYTRGVFNVNIPTFLGLRKDFSHGMTAGNNSDEITLMELFDAAMGGSGGQNPLYAANYGGITGTLANNAKKNARQMVVATITVPIAFKLAKKLMGKAGVTRGINRTLDMVDLKEVRV
jgi:hypothetical protein